MGTYLVFHLEVSGSIAGPSSIVNLYDMYYEGEMSSDLHTADSPTIKDLYKRGRNECAYESSIRND
jgi:hypothetical protein